MEGSPHSIVKGGKEKQGDSEAHTFIEFKVGKLKESASLMAWFSHWSRMSDENEEKRKAKILK